MQTSSKSNGYKAENGFCGYWRAITVLFLIATLNLGIDAKLCAKSPLGQVIPSTWCETNNPFVMPYLFSETHFPAATREYQCDSDDPMADCRNVISVDAYEKGDTRHILFALQSGHVIVVDFNTYKVLHKSKPFDHIFDFISLDERTYVATNKLEIVQIRIGSESAESVILWREPIDTSVYSLDSIGFLQARNSRFVFALLKRTNVTGEGEQYDLKFTNMDDYTEFVWSIQVPVNQGSPKIKVFSQLGNFTGTTSLRSMNSTTHRTLLVINTEKEYRVFNFMEQAMTIVFGDNTLPSRLSLFYQVENPTTIITEASMLGEEMLRPTNSSTCQNFEPIYRSMNIYLILSLYDTATNISNLLIKHLPEFGYYNFSIVGTPGNPVQRSDDFDCPVNHYLVFGVCVPSIEHLVPLASRVCCVITKFTNSSKGVFIKTRFIDIPLINNRLNPYKTDGSLNLQFACESLQFINATQYSECVAKIQQTFKCDLDYIRSNISFPIVDSLLSNFLQIALFIGDESNKISVIGIQPVFNSTNEIIVEKINEIMLVGKIEDAIISSNGQHLIAAVTRKKWELDSMNRFLQVCQKLKTDPFNTFLSQYESYCKTIPQLEIDLNQFGQYASNCIPGMLCTHLNRSWIASVSDGFYSPRPNLNLACPIGSFCKSGQIYPCPPGYYCDVERLELPKRCPTDPTYSKSCFGNSNIAPKACPAGALCIAPYFPPLPSPPGYYVDERHTLHSCSIGDYCNLGRNATRITSNELKCPALTYCPSPSVMEPEPCNCNASHCSYCPSGMSVENPCPIGHYCRVDQKRLQPVITPCSNRTYCTQNTVLPTLCPAKYYCPTPSQKIICPAGHFCRAGMTEPVKCAFLSSCPEGVETNQVNFTGIAAILLLFIFLIITYQSIRCGKLIVEKVLKRLNQKRISKRTALIPTHIIQPLPNNFYLMDVRCEHLGLIVNGNKCVLNDVNAEFKRGTLTAIMGPSGCGKSSFITALADLAFYGRRIGKVFVNEMECSLMEFSDLVGFVPQDDIMIRTMTVWETLFFSAINRLAHKKSLSDISCIVRWVIQTLGLEDVQNSIIGDEKDRGISGGQRKRVNIGMELVAQPSLLLLDEPTSGLDSNASQEVCRALQTIASTGITVLTVIHQPRYEIFQMFDNVLLLAKGGNTVYMGPAKDVLSYFELHGFRCPERMNPADFFLDVVANTVFNERNLLKPNNLVRKWKEKESKEKLIAKHEYYEQVTNSVRINTETQINLEEQFSEQTVVVILTKKYYSQYHSIQEQLLESPKKYMRLSTSVVIQFVACLVRSIIQQLRDWSSFIIDNCLITIGALLLSISIVGLSFEGPLDDEVCKGIPSQLQVLCNLPANDLALKIALILPVIVVMSGVMASIGTFAKNIGNIPNILISPFVFQCIFQSFAAPRASFLTYYWVLLVSCFCGYGLGYLLSVIFRPGLAYLAGAVVVLSYGQFSWPLSAFLNSSFYPLRIMPYFSIIRWVTELVYLVEIREYDKLNIYKIDRTISNYMYTYDNIWRAPLIILGYGLAFRILAFIVLWQSKPNSFILTAVRRVKTHFIHLKETLAEWYIAKKFYIKQHIFFMERASMAEMYLDNSTVETYKQHW